MMRILCPAQPGWLLLRLSWLLLCLGWQAEIGLSYGTSAEFLGRGDDVGGLGVFLLFWGSIVGHSPLEPCLLKGFLDSYEEG